MLEYISVTRTGFLSQIDYEWLLHYLDWPDLQITCQLKGNKEKCNSYSLSGPLKSQSGKTDNMKSPHQKQPYDNPMLSDRRKMFFKIKSLSFLLVFYLRSCKGGKHLPIFFDLEYLQKILGFYKNFKSKISVFYKIFSRSSTFSKIFQK